MLRLLRSFRSKNVSSSFRKYLPYAIGELALIVLGVLIAIWINAQWENTVDRDRERLILTGMLHDFQDNLIQLKAKIRILEKDMQSTVFLFDSPDIDYNTFSNDTLNLLISRATGVPTFDPIDGTLSEVFTTGSLEILRNRQLKNFLITWSKSLQEIKEVESLLLGYRANYFNPFFIKRMEMSHVFEVVPGKDYSALDSKYRQSKIDLLSDFEFRNMLSYKYSRIKILVNRYKALEIRINAILEQLNEELD